MDRRVWTAMLLLMVGGALLILNQGRYSGAVPALYREGNQPRDLRIVGFSTIGNVVIDEFVSREGGGDVTGVPIEPCDIFDVCYRPRRSGGLVPMPGVAVFSNIGAARQM